MSDPLIKSGGMTCKTPPPTPTENVDSSVLALPMLPQRFVAMSTLELQSSYSQQRLSPLPVIVSVKVCAEPAMGDDSVAVPVNVVVCDGPPTNPPAGATMQFAPVVIVVVDASLDVLVSPASLVVIDPPPSLVDALPLSVVLDDPPSLVLVATPPSEIFPPSLFDPDGHAYAPESESSKPSSPVAPHPTKAAPTKNSGKKARFLLGFVFRLIRAERLTAASRKSALEVQNVFIQFAQSRSISVVVATGTVDVRLPR